MTRLDRMLYSSSLYDRFQIILLIYLMTLHELVFHFRHKHFYLLRNTPKSSD